MNRIIREAPAIEEIFHMGKDWGVHLVMIKGKSKNVGLSLADATAEGDVEVLAIDRPHAFLPKPGGEESIMEGDRLLVYGSSKSVERFLG